MHKTVLIIDNDSAQAEALKAYLIRFSFKVLAAPTAAAGIELLSGQAIDLIVLEATLPEKTGLQVCKEIREKSDIPIVMLTARREHADCVLALEIGADDYVPKPFEPRELVARIEAILRRSRFIEKRRNLRFKDLEINVRDHTVRAFGKPIELTSTEFQTLVILASKPGVVFGRDEIMDHLRGIEYGAFSRTIDVTLSRLRSKLQDDPKSPRFIKTIWGAGYIFLGVKEEAR